MCICEIYCVYVPNVDLRKYHTEGKEAHYIQINHIVNQLTQKKITEDWEKKQSLTSC